jgi:pimeloyl-ACP methyl ester carboxylesterase
MTETTPDQILARAQVPSTNGRPIRKDEIELHDRGVYIESWLPERRSRRKPLLFVHGELAGSWVWERDLGYFASRGWEGHAINLQNHFWSRTADPTELTFETYVGDVVAALARLGPSTVVIGHGMGALLALKAAEQAPIAGIVLLGAALAHLLGIDPETVATSGRVRFTKSAGEAVAAVDEARDGVDAAFLLEPTPVAAIAAVAADGDVMPQKSTYFHPKALTGLVINPHEW